VYQPNERDSKVSRGIADGRIAASGVPANETFFPEAHAGEHFSSLFEGNFGRDGLNNVGTPITIQDLARPS
jgi:hypothetical protein